MEKDFDNWNSLKKHLHTEGKNCFYHEREIWWCSLGVNIGHEEDGKGDQSGRPILVMKAFSRQLCWAVPLTSSRKSNIYYVPIGNVEGNPAAAIISQTRPIDTRRFINKIGNLNQEYFDITKQAIKDML